MADRTTVDVIQKLIGRAFLPVVRAQDLDPHAGAVNAWNVLYSMSVGSVDWLHKTGFQLRHPFGSRHPLYVETAEDRADFGYINADLTSIGKDSHIWPSDWFDLNWCPCPTGEEDYPAWDGWPTLDDSLLAYPIHSSSRVMVFEKGLMYKVERGVGSGTLPYNDWFTVENQSVWPELYSDANTEIRLFRFSSATESAEQGQWIPSGSVVECPMSFDANHTHFDFFIGPSATYDIPDDEPRFFMLYWRSPEPSYLSGQSRPTVSSNSDATSFLTITPGDDARHLFDSNRYDLVSYQSDADQYMKNRYTTRFDLIDGDDEHYNEQNPIFYRLPELNGSLDDAVDPDAELTGGGYSYVPGVWGYGYSIDMGTDNPSDRNVVIPVIICFQAKAAESVDVQVIRGPNISPEFQDADWANFSYWPETPDGYELFAKLIVQQFDSVYDAAYRPESRVLHMEFVPSYGTKAIENIDYRVNVAPVMFDAPEFSMNLEAAAAEGLRGLLLLTPYAANQMQGMYDEATYYMGDRVSGILNSYWRMPFSHPSTETDDEVVASVLEHVRSAGTGFAEPLELHSGIRDLVADIFGVQFSVELGSFNANTTASNFGLAITENTPLKLARPIEVFFPADGGCLQYSTEDELVYDYTLRMFLRNQTMDRIRKDIYMSASRYWITNDQAADRLSEGLPRAPYLWPSKIDQIRQWKLYGRTTYVPDVRGGEAHSVTMRPFDPDDPDMLTIEEFRANLEEQYSDDLNSGDQTRIDRAENAILDAITDQEYLYGGFDTVGSRTISNSFAGMDEMVMGVTFYNSTGVATWEASSRQWGGDHPSVSLFDSETGLPRSRYGFTVDGSWYYQSFDEASVQSERRDYVDAHPEGIDVMKRQTNASGAPSTGFAIDGSSILLSTTFTADFTSVSDEIEAIKLKLRAIGTPVGSLVLSINATNDTTKIPEEVLQVSDELDIDDLNNDFEWIEFSFKSPLQLDADERYAINLVCTDPEGEMAILDDDNRVEWAFANADAHSYGATETSGVLSSDASVGESVVYLQDASGFSTSSFYIQIESEVLEVNSRTGNVLSLASAVTDSHSAGSMVYEVVYVASDSDVRWVMDVQETGAFDWVTPSNQEYDATYIIQKRSESIGLVTEVPVGEWGGTDIRVTDGVSDSFYVAPTGQNYDDDFQDDDMYMYGYATGLEPLAGFNVASTYDFPPMNDLRTYATNVTDGYVCWSSKVLNTPSTLSIYPLATVSGGVVNYIPTANDMYITIVCRKWDGSIDAVNVLLPAGSSAPVKISTNKFVSIELLWVDPDEFAEAPFYGFDASEHFRIRSV